MLSTLGMNAGSVTSTDGVRVLKAPLDYLIGLGLNPWYLPPSAQKWVTEPLALITSISE